MAIVYKITNRKNGKIYFGMTTRSLAARFDGHLSAVRQGSKFRFHSAIRKYGVDCWELEVVEESADLNYIRKREEELISEYRTTDNSFGYNAKPGGCGGWIVPEEKYQGWLQKTKERNIGEGNGNFSGLTNDQLFDIVLDEAIKIGRVPTHGHMIKISCNFPKSFAKFRFDGNYRNLAEAVASRLGMIYNPYFRTEEHRAKLRDANVGKIGPNRDTRVKIIDGKRVHAKN